jgi:hypothetical protein
MRSAHGGTPEDRGLFSVSRDTHYTGSGSARPGVSSRSIVEEEEMNGLSRRRLGRLRSWRVLTKEVADFRDEGRVRWRGTCIKRAAVGKVVKYLVATCFVDRLRAGVRPRPVRIKAVVPPPNDHYQRLQHKLPPHGLQGGERPLRGVVDS